jgi:hypothetical protein
MNPGSTSKEHLYFESFDDIPGSCYIESIIYYFLNGKLHRTDGPAIEYENGTKY